MLLDHILKGVTLFVLFSSLLVCCFCRLWQKPDSWNALPGVRSKKPFSSSSSSSSRLPVSHCIWTALVSFSVEATETWTVFMALCWGEQKEWIAVAECCRGLWRQGRIETHRLTFSSAVDRSSVRSEMGVLGCGVLVFALFFQCHSRSVQNPMFRFKRWDSSVP